MSCKFCRKSPCGCKKNALDPQLSATLADMQETIDALTDAAGFLLCGHPILMIENADDVNQFDLSSGKGTGCWEGWGICNGASYPNAKLKKNIPSPNLTDRFVVGAGGSYTVDATGGANTVVLNVTEIPAHNHAVNDPGHTHAIVDLGHNHGTNQSPHTHAATSAPVVVPPFNTSVESGPHNHGYAAPSVTIGYTAGGASANTSNLSALDNTTNEQETHTHTVTIPPFAVSPIISPASISIVVQNSFTGITNAAATTGVTIANTGGGAAHENRPPYFALLFIMKI